MTKILWHSVSPWTPTGYGQQTAINVPRLQAMGHDVAISAYYGLQGSKLRWQGIDIYPSYHQSYGTDAVVPHAVDHFGGDGEGSLRELAAKGLILTLTDVWVLQAPLLSEMAVGAWTPIDHLNVPVPVLRWFQSTGAVPIAMSRFGEDAMRHVGLTPLYVPHCIDTDVFSPGNQPEARERAGLPQDAFIVAIVAANVGKDGERKAFSEQIAAFAELRRRHSDVMLVLHTDVDCPAGVNLRRMLDDLPEGSYTYCDQYAYKKGIPADKLADVYRSADVLSNTSWGEGFGIPIIEAQACGTPVVVTDATAMPELCGAGWKVPFEPFWHDSQGAWAAKPLIGGVIDAYEEAYNQAAGMRDQARVFAEFYDADLVAEMYWRPVLKQLGEALERRAEDARKPFDPVKMPARIVEADGLMWWVRGEGTEDAIGPAEHEASLRPVLDGLLPAGGVFADVGAHVGHWTLRLAHKAGSVVAVEANPETATILRRNLAINDIDNVEIVNVAAWDETTTLRLDDPHGHRAGGSTRTLPSDDGGVPARPLDEIFAGLDRLDLVKLDVEGADLHALRGMAGTLDRLAPTLFIERHDMYGYYELSELEDTLRGLGYQWETAGEYMASVYLLATKK